MGKKLTRRPRSKDGVIYSDIGDHWKLKIAEFSKNREKLIELAGGDVFQDFNLFKNVFSKATGYNEKLLYPEFIITSGLLYSEYESFYIKNESILDFLKNSKIKDSDRNAIYHSSENMIFCQGVEGAIRKPFIINLPNEKNSIFVVISKLSHPDKNIDVFYHICATRADDLLFITVHPNNDDWLNFDSRVDGDNINWNIILNFLMYIDCFKECVIDGVPDIDCRSDTAKIKKTITLHKDIEDVCRQAQITPHMRRGHFRFLQSDKFVNAKGKTVYVKPTMVKGKAKTVIEYS